MTLGMLDLSLPACRGWGSSGSYTVDFKTNGSASNVTGFTASDIEVTGGAVSNFTAVCTIHLR